MRASRVSCERLTGKSPCEIDDVADLDGVLGSLNHQWQCACWERPDADYQSPRRRLPAGPRHWWTFGTYRNKPH